MRVKFSIAATAYAAVTHCSASGRKSNDVARVGLAGRARCDIARTRLKEGALLAKAVLHHGHPSVATISE
eukprot:5855280-Pyramimonas_sp.AAC.1